MADKKVSALTALTNMSSDDLMLVVNDPSGSPASRKITHANFFANVHTVSDFTSNVTISSTKLTVSANTTLNGKLVNGSNTIIGSNGRIHANNAISTGTITQAMLSGAATGVSNSFLTSTYVTNTEFQSYQTITNVTLTTLADKTANTAQVFQANVIIDSANSSVSTTGVHISNGAIQMYSATGSPSYLDLYCEVNNAHRVRLQAPAHAYYSGNIVTTLPTKSGNVATTNSETFTGTTSAENLTVNDVFRITTKSSDFSTSNAATESVTAGSIYYSNTYLYVVTDSNTIKRIALSTF
jgi:hypothetical protein